MYSVNLPIPIAPPNKTVVIDTETTGLDFRQDRIIELSAIDGAGRTLLSTYVNPGEDMMKYGWYEAETVNHISPDMVKDCPTMERLKDQMSNILSNADLLVSYNGDFDFRFLMNEGVKIKDATKKKYYDCMREFAPVYGEYDEAHGSFRWKNLITAAEYYGYDWSRDTAHDSCSDSRATLHVYNSLLHDSRKQELIVAEMEKRQQETYRPIRKQEKAIMEERAIRPLADIDDIKKEVNDHFEEIDPKTIKDNADNIYDAFYEIH